jgi:hypothetical protein
MDGSWVASLIRSDTTGRAFDFGTLANRSAIFEFAIAG